MEDEEDMVELKSCPFCGQDTANIYRNYSSNARTYFVWIECEFCGAKSKSICSYKDPADDDWDSLPCRKAAKSWNTRCGDAK